jgi:hypothetical protein
MNTILKALKKAEDGRVKETLSGQVIANAAEPEPRRRGMALRIGGIVIGGALVLAYLARGSLRQGTAPPAPATPVYTKAPPAPTLPPVPSSPVVKPIAVPPEIRLTGVIWDAKTPTAVINGKVVTVGEEVNGATIVAIDLDAVRVRYRGADYTFNVQ